ncbi:MAG: inverse autotransporter beta domain-containing protein [Bacillota bacterium]
MTQYRKPTALLMIMLLLISMIPTGAFAADDNTIPTFETTQIPQFSDDSTQRFAQTSDYLTQYYLDALKQYAGWDWLTRVQLTGNFFSGTVLPGNDLNWGISTIQPFGSYGDLSSKLLWQAAYQSNNNTANLGLAYRKMNKEQNMMYGVNAFYDNQFSPVAANGTAIPGMHQRVGAGLEFFTGTIEARANGYYGISDPLLVKTTEITATKTVQDWQRVATGFDFTVNTDLSFLSAPWAKVGVGAYDYFFTGQTWNGTTMVSNTSPSGFTANASLQVLPQLQLTGGYDFTNKQSQIGFTLNLLAPPAPAMFMGDPVINGNASQDISYKMLQQVQRNNVITVENYSTLNDTTPAAIVGLIVVVKDASGKPVAKTKVVATPQMQAAAVMAKTPEAITVVTDINGLATITEINGIAYSVNAQYGAVINSGNYTTGVEYAPQEQIANAIISLPNSGGLAIAKADQSGLKTGTIKVEQNGSQVSYDWDISDNYNSAGDLVINGLLPNTPATLIIEHDGFTDRFESVISASSNPTTYNTIESKDVKLTPVGGVNAVLAINAKFSDNTPATGAEVHITNGEKEITALTIDNSGNARISLDTTKYQTVNLVTTYPQKMDISQTQELSAGQTTAVEINLGTNAPEGKVNISAITVEGVGDITAGATMNLVSGTNTYPMTYAKGTAAVVSPGTYTAQVKLGNATLTSTNSVDVAAAKTAEFAPLLPNQGTIKLVISNGDKELNDTYTINNAEINKPQQYATGGVTFADVPVGIYAFTATDKDKNVIAVKTAKPISVSITDMAPIYSGNINTVGAVNLTNITVVEIGEVPTTTNITLTNKEVNYTATYKQGSGAVFANVTPGTYIVTAKLGNGIATATDTIAVQPDKTTSETVTLPNAGTITIKIYNNNVELDNSYTIVNNQTKASVQYTPGGVNFSDLKFGVYTFSATKGTYFTTPVNGTTTRVNVSDIAPSYEMTISQISVLDITKITAGTTELPTGTIVTIATATNTYSKPYTVGTGVNFVVEPGAYSVTAKLGNGTLTTKPTYTVGVNEVKSTTTELAAIGNMTLKVNAAEGTELDSSYKITNDQTKTSVQYKAGGINFAALPFGTYTFTATKNNIDLPIAVSGSTIGMSDVAPTVTGTIATVGYVTITGVTVDTVGEIPAGTQLKLVNGATNYAGVYAAGGLTIGNVTPGSYELVATFGTGTATSISKINVVKSETTTTAAVLENKGAIKIKVFTGGVELDQSYTITNDQTEKTVVYTPGGITFDNLKHGSYTFTAKKGDYYSTKVSGDMAMLVGFADTTPAYSTTIGQLSVLDISKISVGNIELPTGTGVTVTSGANVYTKAYTVGSGINYIVQPGTYNLSVKLGNGTIADTATYPVTLGTVKTATSTLPAIGTLKLQLNYAGGAELDSGYIVKNVQTGAVIIYATGGVTFTAVPFGTYAFTASKNGNELPVTVADATVGMTDVAPLVAGTIDNVGYVQPATISVNEVGVIPVGTALTLTNAINTYKTTYVAGGQTTFGKVAAGTYDLTANFGSGIAHGLAPIVITSGKYAIDALTLENTGTVKLVLTSNGIELDGTFQIKNDQTGTTTPYIAGGVTFNSQKHGTYTYTANKGGYYTTPVNAGQPITISFADTAPTYSATITQQAVVTIPSISVAGMELPSGTTVTVTDNANIYTAAYTSGSGVNFVVTPGTYTASAKLGNGTLTATNTVAANGNGIYSYTPTLPNSGTIHINVKLDNGNEAAYDGRHYFVTNDQTGQKIKYTPGGVSFNLPFGTYSFTVTQDEGTGIVFHTQALTLDSAATIGFANVAPNVNSTIPNLSLAQITIPNFTVVGAGELPTGKAFTLTSAAKIYNMNYTPGMTAIIEPGTYTAQVVLGDGTLKSTNNVVVADSSVVTFGPQFPNSGLVHIAVAYDTGSEIGNDGRNYYVTLNGGGAKVKYTPGGIDFPLPFGNYSFTLTREENNVLFVNEPLGEAAINFDNIKRTIGKAIPVQNIGKLTITSIAVDGIGEVPNGKPLTLTSENATYNLTYTKGMQVDVAPGNYKAIVTLGNGTLTSTAVQPMTDGSVNTAGYVLPNQGNMHIDIRFDQGGEPGDSTHSLIYYVICQQDGQKIQYTPGGVDFKKPFGNYSFSFSAEDEQGFVYYTQIMSLNSFGDINMSEVGPIRASTVTYRTALRVSGVTTNNAVDIANGGTIKISGNGQSYSAKAVNGQALFLDIPNGNYQSTIVTTLGIETSPVTVNKKSDTETMAITYPKIQKQVIIHPNMFANNVSVQQHGQVILEQHFDVTFVDYTRTMLVTTDIVGGDLTVSEHVWGGSMGGDWAYDYSQILPINSSIGSPDYWMKSYPGVWSESTIWTPSQQ